MDTTEGKPGNGIDEVRPSHKDAVRQAFRPVYISLKAFCLFSDLLSRYCRKKDKIMDRANAIHFVYCLVVGSWAVTNVVKHAYELYSIGNDGIYTSLAIYITNSVLTLVFGLYIPILLWKLSTRLDGILDKVQTLFLETQTIINARVWKNALLLIIIIYIGSTLTVTLMLMDGTWNTMNTSSTLVTAPITYDLIANAELSPIVILVWTVIQVMVYSGAAISILTLIGCYAFFVQKCVSGILKDVKMMEAQGTTYGALRKCRMNFELLVDIVDAMDVSVSFPAGAIHILGLVAPCLLLYGLAHDTLSAEDITFLLTYIGSTGVNTMLFIGAAIFINAKMHKPLGALYKMDTERLNERGAQELALFISRLSGSPIGISVFGLFVIDTSTVLMMLGTLTAYAVVVMQLQPSGTGGNS